MRRLEDKIALVTGGASGLGKAIAQCLAANGASVVITDIQSDLGYTTAAEFGLTFLEQDVRDESRWVEVIREVEERHGRLNILVNNAGIAGPMDAVTPEQTRLQDWRTITAINVEGVFLGCRAAIPALKRAGGGAIVNMSSIAALMATPDGMAYGASKAAVRQITKSVALACARDRSRIRCNSVHPGNILTTLLQKAMEGIARSRGIAYEQVVEEFKAKSPQGELLEPDDVANAVLFLVSDEARHITGIKLVVDGGTTLAVG